MKLSIGLPTAHPGEPAIGPEALRAWAVEAESCGYWSVALPDRIVYDNNEPLVSLGFVVGATCTLHVITDVLITPTRETTLLAKQVATLDALAGGRLVAGVGIGGRADDYTVTGRTTAGRGRRLEEQMRELKRIWAGGTVEGCAIGPPPARAGGPPMLVGGGAKGIERAASAGDGWSAAWPAGIDERGVLAFSGVGDEPQPLGHRLAELDRGWLDHERDGRPYVLVALYAAVGPTAREDALHHITSWYGFSEKLMAHAVAGLAIGKDDISRYLDAYEAAGVDEVCFANLTGDAATIPALAEVVPGRFLR